MSKQTNKPATETPNKPAHEIRVNGIRATIWANPTEKGVRYNTTFERSYKDGEDWKNTDISTCCIHVRAFSWKQPVCLKSHR